MKSIVLAALFVFTMTNIFAQQGGQYPCIKLSLKSDRDIVKLDSAWQFNIEYRLTNCGKSSIQIDTLSRPNYEENNWDVVNFTIYRYYDNVKMLYPHGYGDIGDAFVDLYSSSSKKIKPGQQHTFKVNLFSYYTIRDKGKYRVYASYRVQLPNKTGYYLQQSENYVDIEVN